MVSGRFAGLASGPDRVMEGALVRFRPNDVGGGVLCVRHRVLCTYGILSNICLLSFEYSDAICHLIDLEKTGKKDKRR